MNINEKISDLEVQLKRIQSELDTLKEYVHNTNEDASTVKPIPNTVVLKQNTPKQSTPKETPHKTASNSSNLEKFFGKYLMGIAASVLIFIGLILFGILIYRNFTDTLKLITIYGSSTVLLVSGYCLLRRQRNAFFLSLTGCGLGAFYTSFILTHTYFNRINDITLYGMLLIWSVLVILIARRYEAVVISVIGQIGILIATIFGLNAMESASSFLMLTIYMIVSTSLFLLFENSNRKHNMYYFLLMSDSFLLLLCGIARIFLWENCLTMPSNTAAILLLLYSCFLLFFFIRKVLTPSAESCAVFGICLLFLIFASSIFIYNLKGAKFLDIETKSLLLVVWLFIWWIVASFLHIKGYARVTTFTLLFSFAILIYQFNIPFLSDHMGLSLFFLPCLLIGTWKQDSMYKLGGYVILGIQLLFYGDLPSRFLPIIVIIGLTLVLAGIILYLDAEHYNVKLKLTHYVYLVAYIILTCFKLHNYSYSQHMYSKTFPIIMFFTTTIMTVLMLQLGWCKDFKTTKDEPLMINTLKKMLLLFLVYGIRLCYSCKISTLIHIVLILWLTVLCLYGLKDFIKIKGIEKGSVILAIKYTAYILLILHSFTIHVRTVTSILCLLIAITCILIGFGLQVKQLRIYGLSLSMLAIAKLLLFDISYKDSIAKIVSFFLCGLLCFLINFIYSIVTKKYEK